MTESVVVAAIQRQTRLGDVAANLKLLTKTVRSTKADLVCFGELFLTGYLTRDAVHRLAQPLDGPVVKAVRTVAARTGRHVLFGMPERSPRARGLTHNSAVLVTPEGAVHAYRKMHLPTFGPFEEQLYFAAGTAPVVARTAIGRIGLSICYDLFFPELFRAQALHGADLLCCISASPMTSRAFFEHLAVARAIENATPLVYCNLSATERQVQFFGGSRIVSARGAVVAAGKIAAPDTVVATIDHGQTASARVGRPTIRDARPQPFEAALRALADLPPL